MSYCVNCGVKLEQTLKSCPLCHTPVLNPNELNIHSMSNGVGPFANTMGEVEPIKKHDMGLWLTLIFSSTALACGILNLFVFDHNHWSIPVIGACIILWIFFCPRMFLPQIPLYLNLIASGISIVLYEFSITFLSNSDRWFFHLALPITLVAMFLIALFGMLYKFVSSSLIASALYLFIDVALLSVSIECLVDHFSGNEIRVFWSAIVFSVCCVISVALIAILSIKRLRETVKKRLHF